VHHSEKKIWRLLKILKIDLSYDPAIPLLGIYPEEHNTGYSKGTCTPMFIEALFIKLHFNSQCYVYYSEFYWNM
jgi:hypothetical protein